MARALALHQDDLQRLTEPWRQGVVTHRPQPVLRDAVACDAVYGVAGHTGHPEVVQNTIARAADSGCREPGVEALWKRTAQIITLGSASPVADRNAD